MSQKFGLVFLFTCSSIKRDFFIPKSSSPNSFIMKNFAFYMDHFSEGKSFASGGGSACRPPRVRVR